MSQQFVVVTACAGNDYAFAAKQRLTLGVEISREIAADLLRAGFLAEVPQDSDTPAVSTTESAPEQTGGAVPPVVVERASTNKKTRINTAKTFTTERE
jgi:hypothetical protein